MRCNAFGVEDSGSSRVVIRMADIEEQSTTRRDRFLLRDFSEGVEEAMAVGVGCLWATFASALRSVDGCFVMGPPTAARGLAASFGISGGPAGGLPHRQCDLDLEPIRKPLTPNPSPRKRSEGRRLLDRLFVVRQLL